MTAGTTFTPAMQFRGLHVDATGLFSIRETAKILGLELRDFMVLCLGMHVLVRKHRTLVPSAIWIETGYLAMEMGKVRFTPKGIEWVNRYLRIDDLLFLWEQAAKRNPRQSSRS